jgi:Tol biopolymer transport system component
MPLTPGTRLGPYEILAPVGAGGMGEIYRARDAKLAREVAIKVLPQEVSADPGRLARFDREARSASALNHPNIVTIYEVGSADAISYICMELVLGRTLRNLLAEGPLPLKRLLALAVQMADGLARAHEAGIVHRDLKPENVMVTREGLVKILDFGLAKRVDTSGAQDSPATTSEFSRPGTLVGTVGYVSPEQLTGRGVDFRSDQFALGSILYEMATGARAFARGTDVETLAAIINDEPESLRHRAPGIPTGLRWAIERCLAKDPEERYASSRDLARDLAQLRDHLAEEAAPATARRRTGRLGVAWAASLILVSAAMLFWGLRGSRSPLVPPVRFSVPLPAGASQLRATVSPDGTVLAMEVANGGQRRIYLRRLDADDTVELPGTLGAAGHFWSPDGRRLAFWADGKLKKIAISGGPPVDLCDAVVLAPGTWSRDGTLLFSQRASPPGLFRVSEAGGEPVRVTACSPAEENHKGPWFLPDGRRFLYHVNAMPGSGSARELRIGSLDSQESRTVARLDSRAEYSALGYLVYAREGALFAQRFDEQKARLRGEPLLLADDVNYFLNTADAGFSISATGVLAYRAGVSPSRLAWIARDGEEVGPLDEPMITSGFRISPDGGRVAMGIRDRRTGTSDLWLFELKRGVSTRLQSDTAHEFMPVWTADGSGLVYASDRQGAPDLYEIATGETSGGEKRVLEQDGFQQPEDLSRDGRFAAYLSADRWPNTDIWLLPLQAERRPSPWARTQFTETGPRFSPDGRWIAYESDESGAPEIYVALTEGGGGKRRISPAGGRHPRWRADGRELYYVGPGDFVVAVPIAPGARLESGAPAPLFRAEGVADFDVTPDGSRFLVATPSDVDRESQVRVVVNWPAALKREK